MPKVPFRSHRQLRKATLRRMYGNPWDTPSRSSTSSRSSSKSSKSSRSSRSPAKTISSRYPKRSSLKKSNTTRKNITFREPLERSASKSKSTTSSAHLAWRSVSSK